jgi:hypothetical protein
MDTITFIRQVVANMHSDADNVLKDTTDEQFNWMPPEMENPMSAIAIHILAAEDDFIHPVLLHQPSLWEVQGWEQQIGVRVPPGPGRGWQDFKDYRFVKVAPVLEYKQVVQAATMAYLETMTPEDLERQVVLFGNKVPTTDVFKLLIAHTTFHIGEMSAIRGIQGVKVLPV